MLPKETKNKQIFLSGIASGLVLLICFVQFFCFVEFFVWLCFVVLFYFCVA